MLFCSFFYPWQGEIVLIPGDKKVKMTIIELLKLNDLIGGYELGTDSLFTQFIEIDDEVDLRVKRRIGMKVVNKRNYRKH